MKIAIFTDTFAPQINGVTKNLNRLLNYFSVQGIEYLLFAPESESRTESIFEKNVVRLKSMNFFLYPELKFTLPNYLKIRSKLIKFNPDLFHLITPFNIGLTGLYAARQSDSPIVASYHTNFNQYLDYYNINFLEKAAWKYLRWFHDQALRNYCPSEETRKELAEKNFINLDIWGRGIDSNLFSPEHRDSKLIKKHGLEDKISILYVGRIAREKNLSLLMDSFKSLNQKYSRKIKLIITGDGPELKSLKKEAPDNVIFTGFKKGRDLSQIYASADIFAFPSVTETYGNVIIEAMASGLPVVAITAGGVKENLLNRYNGLAVKENDSAEFSSQLEQLIINDHLRDALAHNARRYALEQSWDHVFESLDKSYQQVIDDYTRVYGRAVSKNII
ncbi:glycosyltransferase involved in cell wall biosynthesis [Halanaerobium saccharolyticum]|uniref:Glycosyltransferase involved in cell wall biosynthesis n=1 Tax=Halanaerobium saccharolyticum TaxID=43595 RepID=A0A4R6LHC6_9FIRM|nr:glycosyltransferase family 1 protein [Halanaerobium saccharolyticum]TDO83368.1 glycosyltransferase involved in cell wall biosynthesis [Halanaerobium saccharolyticum]